MKLTPHQEHLLKELRRELHSLQDEQSTVSRVAAALQSNCAPLLDISNGAPVDIRTTNEARAYLHRWNARIYEHAEKMSPFFEYEVICGFLLRMLILNIE